MFCIFDHSSITNEAVVLDTSDCSLEAYSLDVLKGYVQRGIVIEGFYIRKDGSVHLDIWNTFVCGVPSIKKALTIINSRNKVMGLEIYTSGTGFIVPTYRSLPKKLIIKDIVTDIMNTSFSTCENTLNVESIVLSRNMKKLSGWTFSHLQNLKSVRLNEGLVEIGAEAFVKTKVSKINIPSTLKVLKSAGLRNSRECPIQRLDFPESMRELGCGQGSVTAVNMPLRIDNVSKAEISMFNDLKVLAINGEYSKQLYQGLFYTRRDGRLIGDDFGKLIACTDNAELKTALKYRPKVEILPYGAYNSVCDKLNLRSEL